MIAKSKLNYELLADDELVIVDGHNDTMMKVVDENTWLPKNNLGKKTDNHIDIPKLKKSGINALCFAAYTHGYYGNTAKSISRTLALINALYWTESRNQDYFKIIKFVDEISKTIKDNKIGAILTIEGGYSLNKENSSELLKQYYDLGVRMLALTWNYSNELGEGASRVYGDLSNTPSKGGLTEVGSTVIKEMNKLGMVIDVSHLAENTFWDVIEITKAPVIASHSGVYSLRNHPRNLTDSQLKAIRQNNGVVGAVLSQNFLKESKEAYISDYIDHIDYIVNLIGIDYVGIGSDFDGTTLPLDLNDVSEFYKMVEELKKRGYKKEDLEKILGINMLRVFREVENLGINEGNKSEFSIIPEFKMGEIITNSMSLLSAKIESGNLREIDKRNSKVMIDGFTYVPKYNEETSTLYLQIPKSLQEKFHVITFEVIDIQGNIKRESRIIYIDF